LILEIVILLILVIGVVGLTLAYFANSTSVDNIFTTQPYGTTVEEVFTAPSNWLPGDTTSKTLTATNTGNVDEAVRISLSESWTTHNNGTLNGWIHPDGSKSTHTTELELANDERVAILNLANTSDWTKVGNYYYYNYKLAPGDETTSFLESVTFNAKTKLDDTCVTTTSGSTKTITCDSSGDDYDNATYTLTVTVETVQYNKYNEAWNLNNTVAISSESKPQGVNFAQAIMSKSNAASVTNYTDGVTTEAYTFNHEATAQTPALTDYRYIGASPNNYVEFNCDDNGENCEIWRAIGVFYVDDGNNNWEWRVKLVRGSALPDEMVWNNLLYNEEEDDYYGINDWTNASLKTYLNDIYLNSLSTSSKLMINDAKYYLGAAIWNYDGSQYGSTDQIYNWERGNILCGSCESDLSKLNWIGKVGIMYPSDVYMVYKGINIACYNNPSDYSMCDSLNASSGWIYNSNKKDEENSTWIWLLSPSSGNTTNVLEVYASGHLSNSSVGIKDSHANRPVLYLSSSVKITDGTGEQNNPYKLGL